MDHVQTVVREYVEEVVIDRPSIASEENIAPIAVVAVAVPAKAGDMSASNATSNTMHDDVTLPSPSDNSSAGPAAISAKFLAVEPSEPTFRVGDAFPVYEHNMLIDPERYGLPRVDGNWRYYAVDRVVYRVDAHAHTVLGIVEGGNQALR